MKKTYAIRIDEEDCIKLRNKVNLLKNYSNYSEYINYLIKEDLKCNIDKRTKKEVMEENILKVNYEMINNKKNKNALKQINDYYKELTTIKKDIINIYFNFDNEEILKEYYKNIMKQIDCLIINEKHNFKTVNYIQKELKIIRNTIENGDFPKLLELCDVNNKEKKMLFHLLLKFGIQPRPIFNKHNIRIR